MKKEIIEKLGLVKDETKYTNRYKMGDIYVSDEDEFGMRHPNGLIYFIGKGLIKTTEEFILSVENEIINETLKRIQK